VILLLCVLIVKTLKQNSTCSALVMQLYKQKGLAKNLVQYDNSKLVKLEKLKG
jgi:hypothetical protein